MQHAKTTEIEQCMADCHHCHVTCLSTAMDHCLELGGKHVEPAHLRLMFDCAQICQTALDFMARGSPYHAQLCRACAEICRACAASCEELGDMDQCVKACRACTESCEKMAA